MDNYYLARYTIKWAEESIIANGLVDQTRKIEIKFEAQDDGLAKKIAEDKRAELHNQYGISPSVRNSSETSSVTLDALMYVKDIIKEQPKQEYNPAPSGAPSDRTYDIENGPQVIWGT